MSEQTSYGKLGSPEPQRLWEQAIADENWEYANSLSTANSSTDWSAPTLYSHGFRVSEIQQVWDEVLEEYHLNLEKDVNADTVVMRKLDERLAQIVLDHPGVVDTEADARP